MFPWVAAGRHLTVSTVPGVAIVNPLGHTGTLAEANAGAEPTLPASELEIIATVAGRVRELAERPLDDRAWIVVYLDVVEIGPYPLVGCGRS